MFSLFRKKKGEQINPLEEVKITKKAKTNIAEIMDSGSFIGKYESVEKRYFRDVVIEEYVEPFSASYLTKEDQAISVKSGGIQYADYSPSGLNASSGTIGPIGTAGPVGLPTVMFGTDEIINNPSLVSIGRSKVTGQHVYKYLGGDAKGLNEIGIEWTELI